MKTSAKASRSTKSAPSPEVSMLTRPDEPDLELLFMPAKTPGRPPIVMIHGAYTDAWSWVPTFMPWFASKGYPVYAVSLRGHGGSNGRSALDFWGLADYQRDLEAVLEHIDQPCILMGSSMGGLIMQRVLREASNVLAAVGICSVPPSGMMSSLMKMAWQAPKDFASVLQVAFNTLPDGKFINMLAHQPMRSKDPGYYFEHIYRESSRALWEINWAPMPGEANANTPMLAMHGAEDRLLPSDSVDTLAADYGAETLIIENIGHLPMIEREWQRVATPIAQWLNKTLTLENNQ